jgi:hypothetical protein
VSEDTPPVENGSPQAVLPISDDADQTMVMKVANLGFLLERLGEDCDDLQYLRELTENALEAEALRVVWDVDQKLFDLTGQLKLCCIDDGRGMTGTEMVQHINHLSSSGHIQSVDGNFGVGAKIAAATRNPAGVLYQSWVDGKGAMIQLWRDPETQQYGLKQFQLPDGSYSHVVPLGEEAKPEQIDQHGTKVTLLGHGPEERTIDGPPGVLTRSRWFNRQLGSRYFRFPKDVDVRAREGWDQPREDTDVNLLRKVRGMEWFLNKYSDQSGTVSLDGSDVHWWILEDSDARRSYSLPNTGHFAALHKEELYELTTGRAGTARLQQFGVIFGADRVVLYVEPRNGGPRRLTSNTARSQLLLDGSSLPYSDWAAEFRAEKMPQEIRDYMDAVISGARGADHRQSIEERLKNYSKLYRLSRVRPRAGGKDAATSPTAETSDLEDSGVGGPAKPERSKKPKKKRDTTGDVLASALAAEGLDAEEAEEGPPPLPRIKWLSENDDPPSRSPEELEDRAAKYLPEVNMLQINADFRVFVNMVQHWCNEYELEPNNEFVIEVVREWFEQTLIETVIGCQQLQGDRRWSSSDLEAVLSEVALTAAVMPRYHVANAIKRALGAKLGTLRDRTEATAAA